MVIQAGERLHRHVSKSLADKKARNEREESKGEASGMRRVGHVVGGDAVRNGGAPVEYRLDPDVDIDSLKCPITMETIKEPASTVYGHLYELSAIQ